ncbi:MAG: hypothetical protein ACRDYD_07925 [Acidimicrobiales bacterium]
MSDRQRQQAGPQGEEPTIPLRMEPGAALRPRRHVYAAVELFLFSASGWHPHRVHYDQGYTRDVEHHDDILVHGPLQAVHLFQALTSQLPPGCRLGSVSYRHLGALHVGEPVTISGGVTELDSEEGIATVEMWMGKDASGQRTTAGTALVVLGPEPEGESDR